MAQIEFAAHEFGAATEHLVESYQICGGLQDLQGICFVDMTLGAILCQVGQKDEGMNMLERSLEGFKRLGLDDIGRAGAKPY